MSTPIICPTVTATNAHEYREQVERVVRFAQRIHVDLMDGIFAPTVSPSLGQVWWPEETTADIHLMYQRPVDYVDALLERRPHMVITPAESEGDLAAFADTLQAAHIKFGVALLPDTELSTDTEKLIERADQVLIFSGHLGYHGGKADLNLITRIPAIRALNPQTEIAWDGGVNEQNVAQLVRAGIDVLNVGGFIQNASDARAAYATLVGLT